MANFHTIMRLRPETRSYVRHGGWVHRGDAVTYLPNIRCDSFSTGPDGFRHSNFAGETLSVDDCLQRTRYGIVLGSSHVFGFGVPGNEQTIPSVLAERLGLPFANVSLPEASSRNLYSLLVGILANAANPPAVVLHLNGGDFTSFCFTSIADPVFGPPNIRQFVTATKERNGPPDPGTQIGPLLAFSSLWLRALADLCHHHRVPMVLGHETTFFEKAVPSALERKCQLGTPSQDAQKRQFAVHKAFIAQFLERRASLAAALGLPLPGLGQADKLGFVDEFHYDSEGTRALSGEFAAAIAPLL